MSVENNNDAMRNFAKAGIGGSAVLNSGALIAMVSNIEFLPGTFGREAVSDAMLSWTIGVCLATVCWVFAYMAASAYANSNRTLEGIFAAGGLLVFIASIGAFGWGMLQLAQGLTT